jgi:hypothetical protein
MMRKIFASKRFSPNDNITYKIPSEIISVTERVLEDYANLEPSNEGLVYWAGVKENEIIDVKMVIAPNTQSTYGSVKTSHFSNFDAILQMSKNNFVQIGQVHSHPTSWVDHSPGDNEYAAFKVNGLLSLVISNYCQNGMLPLVSCGVHRFESGRFIRLSNKYIETHFFVIEEQQTIFVDLRK